MKEVQPQAKYDPIVKTLHWTWAFTWIAVWIIGILAVYWRDALNSDHGLTIAHMAIAMTLLILIVARIAWGLTHKPPQPAAPMTADERAAHVAHLILYALAIFALPLSGWVWGSIADEPITLLWLIKVPPLVAPAPAYYDIAMWIHVGIAWTTGLLVVAHVLMALKHHFIDRDDKLRNMLPGRLG